MEPIETMNCEGTLPGGNEEMIHAASVAVGDETAYNLLEWFEHVEPARVFPFALTVCVSYD